MFCCKSITERAWHKIRDELVNDLNLPLAYDPVRKTYYYTEEGQLVFGFQRKLNNSDMEKLEGGRKLQTTGPLWSFGSLISVGYQNIQA
ncbi:hypothetical protein GGR92_004506 [Spirosoma lacussanchae]